MKSAATRLTAFFTAALLMLIPTVRGQTTPVLTTLYNVVSAGDDACEAPLIQGSDGNFYGTTLSMIFSITPAGVLTTLDMSAGFQAALVQGSDGNFYGTSGDGGGGRVFSITPAGVLTVLHSFGEDTPNPSNALIQGSDGNFYGTTLGLPGDGIIYSITPAGVFTTLHSFTDAEGTGSYAALVQGSDSNFYGTTVGLGFDNNNGTVFSVTPAGVFTILHSFTGTSTDGGFPTAALIQGSDGNFYGTTSEGGSTGNGTVFQMTPAGVLAILHSFTGTGADGADPEASLVQGSDGNFYGTTREGGSNGTGTVFQMTPAGILTTLHSFGALDSDGKSIDGTNPRAALVQGSDGSFYGTTEGFEPDSGGPNTNSTVFKLSFVPAPGTLQFTAATSSTTENAGIVTLSVQRTGGSAGAVTVDYATSDGTAFAGTDYTATSGTLGWADGDATDKTVTVPLTDRSLYDGSTKTFTVTLSNATGGAALGSPLTASVNILDNDTAPQPTVAIASPVNGATFVVGASVPFAASVTDPGGILSAVTFTVNGNQVYQSTGHGPFVTNVDTTPYPPGDYVVAAAVADNQGRTNSSTVTVHLAAAAVGVTPPTASVLTPLLDQNGLPRNLAAGSTITVSFTAASADGTPLQKVSLYADGVLVAAFDASGNPVTMAAGGRPVRRAAATGLGTIFQTPYTLPGVDKLVNLVAVALDKLGHSTVSSVATIHSTVTTDKPPVVMLGGLVSGTHVKVGSTTPISVSASDPDAVNGALAGSLGRQDAAGDAVLAKLEYYINGLFDHSTTQPPFDFTFSPPSSGKYALNVVATDGAGLATISDPITVTVDSVASTVSVAASVAAVEGGAKGIVLVTRMGGDDSAALTVSYKVKGAAVAGVDYKMLPGMVTIPAGASKAKIKVKPIDGSPNAGVLKIKIVLVAPTNGSYTVGTGTAKLKLIGK